MKNPLNEQERTLAQQESDMVMEYIGRRRLSKVDFYDLAAEGFLRAAQIYSAREDLRSKHDFSAIATMCMKAKISGHFVKEKRRHKIAPMVRLRADMGQECSMLRALESRETYASLCESIAQVLTPRQSALIRQLAEGATEQELGREHGLTLAQVRQELTQARKALDPHRDELYAIAAA